MKTGETGNDRSFVLRRNFPVDILIQPTVARTPVAGQSAGGKREAALQDVGGVFVIARGFALIDTRDSIAPVGP